jgi:hypothetical protein
MEMQGMTDDEYARKLDEIDRQLNNPELQLRPELIWHLLDEVLQHDAQAGNSLSRSSRGL